MRRLHSGLIAVLVLVAAVSTGAREVYHSRLVLPGKGAAASEWKSFDPDGFYHMRQVQRLLDEGSPVPNRDPLLSFPEGSRIPWPPYYTRFVATLVGPFAPAGEGPARRAYIERAVATVPMLLGVLTSLLAALLGWSLARAPGALFAGVHQALCFGAINYSRVGNGDHHAFVSLLYLGMVGSLWLGLRRDVLARPRACAALGALLGLLVGVALGSWVGFFLYLFHLEAILGWLYLFGQKEERRGLLAVWTSSHAVAFAVLLPAILRSPWTSDGPWQLVNLSYVHGAALVLAPLGPLLHARLFRARHPSLGSGAALFGLIGLVTAAFFAAVPDAFRELATGFGWMGGSGNFMSEIAESGSVVGPGAGGRTLVTLFLGYGAFLALPAWGIAVLDARRRRSLVNSPWLVVLPLLFVPTLFQTRFASTLSGPLSVLIVLGVLAAVRWRSATGTEAAPEGTLSRGRLAALSGGALLFAVLLQLPSVSLGANLHRIDGTPARARMLRLRIAERLAYRWIRNQTPETGAFSVLAPWHHGHGIEWAAERATVATNFGDYADGDGLADVARFFLANDPAAAEGILEESRADYVLLTSRFPSALPQMFRSLRSLGGERAAAADALHEPGEPLQLTEAWRETLGARLMGSGRSPLDPSSIGFLRLVYTSPIQEASSLDGGAVPVPCVWIWQRVRGAEVVARGAPGETFAVRVDVDHRGGKTAIVFEAVTTLGPDGVGRLRVPYATDRPGGRGKAKGPARWRIGERAGRIELAEVDVLQGARVPLR